MKNENRKNKRIPDLPTGSFFLPTRPTGNDFLLKGGLRLQVPGTYTGVTGVDIKVLLLPAPGQVILNFYLPKHNVYLPIVTEKPAMAHIFESWLPKRLNFYLPKGQAKVKFYLPNPKIYLPWAGGQCLMSSPAVCQKIL